MGACRTCAGRPCSDHAIDVPGSDTDHEAPYKSTIPDPRSLTYQISISRCVARNASERITAYSAWSLVQLNPRKFPSPSQPFFSPSLDSVPRDQIIRVSKAPKLFSLTHESHASLCHAIPFLTDSRISLRKRFERFFCQKTFSFLFFVLDLRENFLRRHFSGRFLFFFFIEPRILWRFGR